MKCRLTIALACLAAPLVPAMAGTVPGPAMYPPGLWQGRAQAMIRVLNRMDSSSEVLTADANGQVHYRTLDITVRHCLERPPTVPGDAAVDMTIHDTTPDTPSFDGWMLASIPSLAMLQSPLYEVHVVGCAGGPTAPQLPPLAVLSASPPADTQAATNPSGAPTPLTSDSNAPTQLVPPDPQGPPATRAPTANAPTQLVPPDATPAPSQDTPPPQGDEPLPPPTPLVPDGN